MTSQNIIIYDFEEMFNILNEIKEIFKFNLISVKNSIFGKTTEVLKEVTAPFVGIYSTKQLIEGFSD